MREDDLDVALCTQSAALQQRLAVVHTPPVHVETCREGGWRMRERGRMRGEERREGREGEGGSMVEDCTDM